VGSELRPEEPDYPVRLLRLNQQLDMGLTVYVDHCEYGTSKKLVIVKATALTREGSFPPIYNHYLFLSWLERGSMWIPDLDISWDYIASKLSISQWPGDAKSISAFLQNLGMIGGMADPRPLAGLPQLVKAGDL